jgi:hypothetical protein
VPHVVDELLGRELLVAPPLVEDILILQRWGDKVVEGRSVVNCAPEPPSVEAWGGDGS